MIEPIATLPFPASNGPPAISRNENASGKESVFAAEQARQRESQSPPPETVGPVAEVTTETAPTRESVDAPQTDNGSGGRDPLTRVADTIARGVSDLDLDAGDIIGALGSSSLEDSQALVQAIENGSREEASRLISGTTGSSRSTKEYGSLVDLRV